MSSPRWSPSVTVAAVVERARQLFTVERFDLPTYRYYRNSGTSIVDTVKQTWPAASAAP